MPTKNFTVEQAIQRELPGWKIVKSRAVADTATEPAGSVQADAVSPGLAAQRAKTGTPVKPSAKSAKSKRKSACHAQFVTVAPVSQPDTVRKFQKVVLVKDGKVVAQQG